MDEFTKEENRVKTKLDITTQKVEGLFQKLENYKEAKIRKVAQNVKNYRDKVNSLEPQIRLKESQLDSKEFELKETIENLANAEGLSDANKQWKVKGEFAKKTLDYFTQFKHDITSEIRLLVQKRTEERNITVKTC